MANRKALCVASGAALAGSDGPAATGSGQASSPGRALVYRALSDHAPPVWREVRDGASARATRSSG